MTRVEAFSPSYAHLAELKTELDALRCELAELRGQQANNGTGHRGRASYAWLSAPLIVAGSWALSAQTPASISPDIEKRLSVLEKLIRSGPGNTTQVTGPFDVLGADGKTILRVESANPNSAATAGVHIGVAPGHGGVVTIRSQNGTMVAGMGVATEGHGAVYASDANGKPRAQLNGTGAVGVFDEKTTQVAVMINKQEGGGRIGVWNSAGKRVAMLDVESENGSAGALSVTDPTGTVVARLGLHPQGGKDAALAIMNSAGTPVAVLRAAGETGALSVMNSAGKSVAGLLGSGTAGGTVAVATSSGSTMAQMSVSDDGRGLFQVFAKTGGRPIAVMTQAIEHVGGLLQISNNSGSPVANLTVGSAGAGYLQLTDPSGTPTVEAGTLADGNGTVRAGPTYQCLPVTLSGPIMFVPNCIMGGVKKK